MAKGIRRYLLAATLMVGGLLAFCGAALGSTIFNALWHMEDPTQLVAEPPSFARSSTLHT
jgi:hypothetical protein